MTPSKIDIEDVVEAKKGKESAGEDVSSVTTSLIHLTLQPDTLKDLAKVEADLAQITLNDGSVQEEDFKKREEEEESRETEEEKKAEKVNVERVDSTKEIEKEKVSHESKDLQDREAVAESKEKEEEEEDEGKEEEEEVGEIEKKSDIKIINLVKDTEEEEDKEEEEEEEEEKKEEEEEESDDENPADSDEDSEVQPKDTKLRSRGLRCGESKGYLPAPHLDYTDANTYQQQQTFQSPFQHDPYSGVWSPQYGQVAGYPGASPTQSGALDAWYGSVQLDSESGKAFTPSFEESSPVSCSSDDGMPSMSYGYSAESPQCYQDVPFANNSQYLESQSSPYQNQASPYLQGMSPTSQYQNQASPYNQALSTTCQYQNQTASFHQGVSPTSQYQNQASPFNQSLSHVSSPSQYNESSFQEPSYTTQMSPFPTEEAHSTLLTPPVSPEPSKTPTTNKLTQEEDLIEIISTVMAQGNFDMSPQDSRIIEIKKNLLDIESCSHNSNLEKELNPQAFQFFYRQFAVLKNEALVEGDKDGDTLYLRTACTGQMELFYKEKLVAITNRVEQMNLCCDSVVDWRLMTCQECGNSDPKTFYSPLSWKNKHGEMLLSNLVILMFPVPVVDYITRKVMQRPMDLHRTFSTNKKLFLEKIGLYPCLQQGLMMLSQSM